MYLTVKQAAHRLGVSTMTIRRWTQTGFLPCQRTAGGHRRIADDDVDDLVRHIGGSSHLIARRARERELETLVETSIAVTSQLDLPDLLLEIAIHMTALIDCGSCGIGEYDRANFRVVILAEYDRTGRPVADMPAYELRDFPLTRKVLDEQITAVVNVDDPHADAAEAAELRRTGDTSLLMVPLVFRGETIGLLEIVDYERPRKYTPRELRLCLAIAGQAAVALKNAHAFAEARRAEADLALLRDSLQQTSVVRDIAQAAGDDAATMRAVAQLACGALETISRVLETGGHDAASGDRGR
jgi:excisionase family DNA binding protein